MLSVNKTIEKKNETLYSFNLRLPTTVVPAKSDSDVIFVYTLTCTLFEITPILRILLIHE